MALPKRRKSHARVRTRRHQWRAAQITKTTCKECGATILPHRLCNACGHYKGNLILPPRVRGAQRPDAE